MDMKLGKTIQQYMFPNELKWIQIIEGGFNIAFCCKHLETSIMARNRKVESNFNISLKFILNNNIVYINQSINFSLAHTKNYHYFIRNE